MFGHGQPKRLSLRMRIFVTDLKDFSILYISFFNHILVCLSVAVLSKGSKRNNGFRSLFSAVVPKYICLI